eukprot:TRINITY_DN12149_c0_g2_i2.p1 TRINITY_DN12149_c0_g2~~TRINITY_DN12149_c0_g2_i2.p1  ORF type:complete len:302 (+),score=18.18 TRINITY_DN12149_c0_g2_i2:37-906(+)
MDCIREPPFSRPKVLYFSNEPGPGSCRGKQRNELRWPYCGNLPALSAVADNGEILSALPFSRHRRASIVDLVISDLLRLVFLPSKQAFLRRHSMRANLGTDRQHHRRQFLVVQLSSLQRHRGNTTGFDFVWWFLSLGLSRIYNVMDNYPRPMIFSCKSLACCDVRTCMIDSHVHFRPLECMIEGVQDRQAVYQQEVDIRKSEFHQPMRAMMLFSSDADPETVALAKARGVNDLRKPWQTAFHFLFQPSDELTDMRRELFRLSNVTKSQPYIGIHLRTGISVTRVAWQVG